MSPAAEKTTKQSTDTQKTGMPIFPPALVQKQDKDEREASDYSLMKRMHCLQSVQK